MYHLKKIQKKVQGYLSHNPALYAMIVGIGIVLFWRGVWHSIDQIHNIVNHIYATSSMDSYPTPWWDGPVSFVVGVFVLFMTGAFTSSFIGNELILSGLRGEKKLSERTESDLKNEINTISTIKEELLIISKKLEIMEKQVTSNHKNLK